MVKELAFLAYSVRDVPRARTFYHEVVGLTIGESYGDRWVEFDVGGVAFGIGDGTPIGIEPGSGSSAAFEVDDVAAMRERLRQHGVTVGEVAESPVCWSCFVTDPDGNRFALHQRKTG